jgi:hypothetical protein
MSEAQLGTFSSASLDFSEAAIGRARAATPVQGLYVSKVLVVGAISGDLRAFFRKAETANRLGCQAILVVGSFGFQSHRLQGEAYLDQTEKYAQRFGVVVVWTPGGQDNLALLARIPAGPDGLITLRPRIRCAPDRASWCWGDAVFATVNDSVLPGHRRVRDSLSRADVLVVRGNVVGNDAVVNPSLRLAVYGTTTHRLISAASPHTGNTVQWTEQAVLDLKSFVCATDEELTRRAPERRDDLEQKLGHLRLYALENNDTFAPRSYVTEDGFRLGEWTAILRRDFEEGRLDADVVRAVEEIPGWQWDPYDPVTVGEGGASAPTDRDPPADAFLPLSSLPVPAEPAHAVSPVEAPPAPARLVGPLPFAIWFRQLQKFVAETGHARPSKNYVDPDGFKLGRWVFHLRDDDRRSRLSAEEVEALGRTAGWTWERKRKPPAPPPSPPPVPDALGGPVGLPAWWMVSRSR